MLTVFRRFSLYIVNCPAVTGGAFYLQPPLPSQRGSLESRHTPEIPGLAPSPKLDQTRSVADSIPFYPEWEFMVLAKALSGRNLDFERRAVLHLRKTNSPETLAGLCWTPPPPDKEFVIIQDFWLSPEIRQGGQMAPCPACPSDAPNYYRGSLAWFPAERVYRCIGRDCAGRHAGIFQARLARKDQNAARQYAADIQFAYDNLGLVPQMIACTEKLLVAATEIERLGHQLGRVPAVRKDLYDRTRGNDGQLLVYRETQIPVYLGSLQGRASLRGRMSFSRQLRILKQMLGAIDHGAEQQARDWLLKCEPDGEALGQARAALRRSARTYAQAREEIFEAFDFFTEENFELIRSFGMHPLNPGQFFAWCAKGEYRIRHGQREIKVQPRRPLLAGLLDWPDFRDSRLQAARGIRPNWIL